MLRVTYSIRGSIPESIALFGFLEENPSQFVPKDAQSNRQAKQDTNPAMMTSSLAPTFHHKLLLALADAALPDAVLVPVEPVLPPLPVVVALPLPPPLPPFTPAAETV
jgi:hypothetical protein